VDLHNSFVVPTDIQATWNALQDVQAVAPCMPGATLDAVDGDTFTGSVKVRLGPVTMLYSGVARFASRDEEAHTVVIEGSGKEAKGAGTAQVHVTAALVEESPVRTRVNVTTYLTITGKAAQFGRGVIQDVAGGIIDQFSRNLESRLASGQPTPASTSPTGDATPAEATIATATHAPVGSQRADAIDLLGAAAAPVLKRALPIAVGVALVVALVIWVTNR